MAGTGQKFDGCGCKLEPENNRDYPSSELKHQSEIFDRWINGFSFLHKEDESLKGLKATAEHCDRSSCFQNTSNSEHKLGLPFQDKNKESENSIVTLSRNEASHIHETFGHGLGNKVTKCYPRTDQGPEVASQTVAEADGPVLEMCRLDLNQSPATEANQSQDGVYVHYKSELQMPVVQKVCVGTIVCKFDMHKKTFRRGYIAMLAVDSKHRRKNIGTDLVKKAICAVVEGDCDEVVLETEITNSSALKLYENLGFVMDKRLFRNYLNGVDTLRLC